ncbi:neurofilament heavy polypeptide-like isoform X2 [Cloeon dipterum]
MGIKFPWFRRQMRLGNVSQMTATLEANARKEPSARSTNVPTQGVFKRWDMDESGPPPEPPRVVIRKDRPAPPVPRTQSLPPSSRKTEPRRSEPPPVVPQRTSSTKEDRRKEKLMRKAEEERMKELKKREVEQRRAEEKALRKSQKVKKRASEPSRPKEAVEEVPPLPVSPVPDLPQSNQAPQLPPKQGPRRLLQTDLDGPSNTVDAPVPVIEAFNNDRLKAAGIYKTSSASEKENARLKKSKEPPKKTVEPPKRVAEPLAREVEPVERVAEVPPGNAFVVSGTEAKGKKKDKKKEKKKTKEAPKSEPPSRRNPRAVLASSSSVESPPLYSVEMPPSPAYEAINEKELFKKMKSHNNWESEPASVMSLEPPVATTMPRSPRPVAKIQSKPRLPAKKKAAAPRPVPVSPPRIYTPPATPPPEYGNEIFPRIDHHSLAFENDGILSFRLPDAPEPIEVHPSFLAFVHSDESDECDA